MKDWVKLPSAWMERGELKAFEWGPVGPTNAGPANTSALMLLMTIAHHADAKKAVAKLTYDQLEEITHVSRTLIADGLEVLEKKKLVIRNPAGRSTYQLANFDPKAGWAALPARVLYSSTGVNLFKDFKLRKRTELEALKIYLAFVARRNRKTNRAHITYQRLETYTGVHKGRIKLAVSVLLNQELVVIDHVKPDESQESSEPGSANAYRLVGIDAYIHPGTLKSKTELKV